MPELPDVECVRRRLVDAMRGATINAVRAADRYVLRPASPAALRRALVGRTVRDVVRRGKWLRIELGDGGRLFSHLGMTGNWADRPPDAPRDRAERARVDVVRADGQEASLRYVDSRRFGRLVVAAAGAADIPEWRELGPDPLEDGIDVRGLAKALAGSRRAVKDALMDQRVIAGVGNILATEALWRARIDPRAPCRALTIEHVRRAARALRREIDRELAAGHECGSGDGGADRAFWVYGRAGRPCLRCGTPLVSVVLGGRTTTFCPRCQVEPTRRGRGKLRP